MPCTRSRIRKRKHRMEVKIVDLCLIIVSGYVQSTSTSPCQSSDIPDSYFYPNYLNKSNKVRVEVAQNGTYIFTIPAPHNCSGTVRFVQYCYQRTVMRNILTLCSKQLQMTNCINKDQDPKILCATDVSAAKNLRLGRMSDSKFPHQIIH